MQAEEQFVEHRGKKYTMKRIPIKEFISLKNYCEAKIDSINLMKVNTDEELASASAKWKEFIDRAFESPDTDIASLEGLTRKEMSDIERDFFLVYWGADPQDFMKLLNRLIDSEKSIK